MSNFVDSIYSEVLKAQKEEITQSLIYRSNDQSSAKNNFVLFIKPELTCVHKTLKYPEIFTMIMDRIQKFNFKIHEIKLLTASYLKQYNITGQHYGVINKVCKNAKKELSESGKVVFKEKYGVSVEEAHVVGGFEFLEEHPYFNPLSLDVLWQDLEITKLGSGVYSDMVTIDFEKIYLINGFHPKQILHFEDKGRSIVVLNVSADIDWKSARNEFLGATNPNKALTNTIRHDLLLRSKEFGIPEISYAKNGVHLSAGPIEGLVELVRFGSDFSDSNKIKTYADYPLGVELMNHFNSKQINDILDNCIVKTPDGKNMSVFDLTEEKNTDETITLLKQVIQ